MKKIFYFAAAALMFASCTKESIDTPNRESDKVFTASFADEGATRTALQSDGLSLQWQSSDAIAINGQKYTISNITGGIATFAAAGTAAEAVGGKYVSVYPNDAATYDTEGALTTVTFPATQTVEAGNFDPAAALMYAESEDTDLKFKNLASILRFELKSEAGIKLKKIEIGAYDSEYDEMYLYGTATVDASDVDNPVIAMTDDTATSLTINTGADGTQLSIPLPPHSVSACRRQLMEIGRSHLQMMMIKNMNSILKVIIPCSVVRYIQSSEPSLRMADA